MTEQPPKTSRTILWYLIFTGFIIDAMIRLNMSITIIDMIIPKNSSIQYSTDRFSFERTFLDLLQVILTFSL